MSAAISRRLRGILALDDFEAAARRHLPRPVFGYVSGAAESDASVRGNWLAFEEINFLPRILNKLSQRSQKTTLASEIDADMGLPGINRLDELGPAQLMPRSGALSR